MPVLRTSDFRMFRSWGSSAWGRPTITHRAMGVVTSQTTSPMRSCRPTHSNSGKPSAPGSPATMTFLRNRRASISESGTVACSDPNAVVVASESGMASK